jgi:hypothetical protein
MTVGWTCAFDDDTRRASAQSFAATTTRVSPEVKSETHPKPQLTHPVILSEGRGFGARPSVFGAGGETQSALLITCHPERGRVGGCEAKDQARRIEQALRGRTKSAVVALPEDQDVLEALALQHLA